MRTEPQPATAPADVPPGPFPDAPFPPPRPAVPPTPPPSPVLPGWFRNRWSSWGGRQREQLVDDLPAGSLPLIEPDPRGNPGFRAVTFLHRHAAASAVILSANGLLDHRNPADMEFDRLDDSDLWALTLRMPADWQAGYRITAHVGAGLPPWRLPGADRRTVRLAADAGAPDPLNPMVGAGMSGAPQSLLQLPGAPDAPWLAAATPEAGSTLPSVMGAGAGDPARARRAGAAVTGLRELVVPDADAGRDRRVWLYLPQLDQDAADLPLVLLHDGQVWAKYLNLAATLDAATAAGVLPPLAVAMIDSLDVPTRTRELSGPTGTVDFVARDLLPLLRTRFPVTDDPARTVASGASFGGLASLWQLARFPELVGVALAQSPSLWRYDLADPLAAVARRIRIRIQAGIYEDTIHRAGEALHRDLARTGADISLRSITGGHDWAWWNPWLIRGLAELLGP